MDCRDCDFWEDGLGCFLPEWEECENRSNRCIDCSRCAASELCDKWYGIKKMPIFSAED